MAMVVVIGTVAVVIVTGAEVVVAININAGGCCGHSLVSGATGLYSSGMYLLGGVNNVSGLLLIAIIMVDSEGRTDLENF